MKKILSFVLCLAMVFSLAVPMGLTASAVHANTLLSAEKAVVANNQVTLVVNINSNVAKFNSALLYFAYDPSVLRVDAAASGAVTILDPDGKPIAKIPGTYVKGATSYYTTQNGTEVALDPAGNYSINYASMKDLETKTAAQPFIKIVFDIIDETAPKTTVTVRCNEANAENSVEHGAYDIVSTQTFSTLGTPALKTTENVQDGVKLTWGAVTGAVSYTVYRKTTGAFQKIADNVTATSYVDATAENGKSYIYTVSAVNAAGDVSAYNASGLAVACVGASNIVSLTNKTDGVAVKWSAVAGASQYYLYRKAEGAASYTRIEKVTAPKLTYLDTKADLKSNVNYTYVVRTVSNGVAAAAGDAKTIRYLAAPVLSSAVNAYTGALVKWQKSEGCSHYIIYRKLSGGSWSKLATVDENTFAYVDKTAQSGKTYVYTVKGYDGSDGSAYYAGVTLKYLASPSKVTVSNATNGAVVKWNQIAGAAGYYVYRMDGSTKKWTRIATLKGATSVAYKDKTAKSGTLYAYTIRAYNGKNLSSFNNSGWRIRFLLTPTLRSASSARAGITVTWSKIGGAKGYTVYRKTSGGSWKTLATISSGSTVSYVDKTAKKGVTYIYTVRAFNGGYKSAYNTKGIACKDKY